MVPWGRSAQVLVGLTSNFVAGVVRNTDIGFFLLI